MTEKKQRRNNLSTNINYALEKKALDFSLGRNVQKVLTFIQKIPFLPC